MSRPSSSNMNYPPIHIRSIAVSKTKAKKLKRDPLALQRQPKIYVFKSIRLDTLTTFAMSLKGIEPEGMFSTPYHQFPVSGNDMHSFIIQKGNWNKVPITLEGFSSHPENSAVRLTHLTDTSIPPLVLSKDAVLKMREKAKVITTHIKALQQGEEAIRIMFSIIVEKYKEQQSATPYLPFSEVSRLVSSYIPVKQIGIEFRQALEKANLTCQFNVNTLYVVVLSQKETIQKMLE